MKRKVALLMVSLALLQATPAWALDAGSAQAYCDDIKKAALDAKKAYVNIYKPQKDPSQTFDDVTSTCTDFIVNFRIGIPSISDELLKNLLKRVCSAAQQKFNSAVNDALQAVNYNNSQYGVYAGGSAAAGTGQGSGINTTVSTDNGNTLSGAVNKGVDGVINRVGKP